MNEVEKYTKLWALPQGYGNNYEDPRMIEIVNTLTNAMGLHTFKTVLDVGGGDQRLAKFFPNHTYTSLDIAPNIMEPGENAYAHIVADISEWWEESLFDWAISIDVMEHLPTDRVESAIANIADATIDGAAFLICTRPDRGGKKIGAVLHMTVQPPVWWVGMLAKEFKKVQLLREVKGEYCLIIAEH